MSEREFGYTGDSPEAAEPAQLPRKPRDPAQTLTSALVVYIFINLALALPLVILPAAFFDAIGLDKVTADQLGGLRWVGAVILAWAITGILVLARPEGRAVFVTAGAFQLTMGALAFLYSWSVAEYEWNTWYQMIGTAVLAVGAVYLWWARLRGRRVFKGGTTAEG